MAPEKKVTKKQLEKYLEKLMKYRDEEIQGIINKVEKQIFTTPFSTTPPGPGPKNPPKIP